MTALNTVEEILGSARASRKCVLSEFESKRVLAAYGVSVAAEELVQDACGAIAAAERLGYPVAVKGCGAGLAHKSDRGLVAINVRDASGVEAAVAAIAASAGDIALDGFLVQRTVRGKREIVIGGVRDPLFGACVMLGVGGILVEAVGDVSFRLAPLDARDVREMAIELRAHRIFGAFRGEPAVDWDDLTDALAGTARLLLERPAISHIDINPLIIEDGKPIAVDASITIQEGNAS